MEKAERTASGSPELLAELTKWVNGEGYPLEFRTAIALHDAGLEVQTGMYVESEEGKQREVDIWADMSWGGKGRPFLKLRIMVECKYGSSPWLVLRGFNQRGGAFDLVSIPSSIRFDDDFLRALLKQERELLANPWLSPQVTRGHGIVEAFRKKRDDGQDRIDPAYAAVQKIASLGHAYARSCSGLMGRHGDDPTMMLVWPMVVVDAPLFATSFQTPGGAITPTAVDAATVTWGTGLNSSIVLVARADTLGQLATPIARELEKLGERIYPLWNSRLASSLRATVPVRRNIRK